MHWRRLRLFVVFFAGSWLWTFPVLASITVQLDAPYSLGQRRTAVQPGETFHALFSVECAEGAAQQVPLSIQLPPGIYWNGRQENWQLRETSTGQILAGSVNLTEGYGQWFDLLNLRTEDSVVPGVYAIGLQAGTERKTVDLAVMLDPAVSSFEKPVLERIVLPLDRDGKNDGKQGANTLVLRDRSLDYYKNVLRGKGASNLEIEAIHPLSHMGLDFFNPSRVQKILLVRAELVDRNTGLPVRGLYTPGSSGDNDGAGAMAANLERLTAMAALTGEKRQRVNLPIYADEDLLAEGRYTLRVVAEDAQSQVWTAEAPVQIVKKNLRALMALGCGVLMLAIYLVLLARRLPAVIKVLKTRRLITIALFGTCAFAVVSVPSTLLNDFFHILLGPFGFLITGMFSGVVLYMLTGALITLMPVQGVPSLMAAVRYLLGLLAFGHMSPIMFLAYGVNTLLLEVVLAVAGITFRQVGTEERRPFSLRNLVALSLACALADTVATYVSLQGTSVLYRLYYADWYIYMMMAVNGFFYTAVGAGCGVLLGRRLAEVGSD